MKCEGRIGAGKFLELSILENVLLLSGWYFALGQILTQTVTTPASWAIEANNIRKQSMVPLLRKLPIARFITLNN